MVTGPNPMLEARRALSLHGTLDTGLAGLGTCVTKCERLPGTVASLYNIRLSRLELPWIFISTC